MRQLPLHRVGGTEGLPRMQGSNHLLYPSTNLLFKQDHYHLLFKPLQRSKWAVPSHHRAFPPRSITFKRPIRLLAAPCPRFRIPLRLPTTFPMFRIARLPTAIYHLTAPCYSLLFLPEIMYRVDTGPAHFCSY